MKAPLPASIFGVRTLQDKSKVSLQCLMCKKTFHAPPSDKAKFCSQECSHKWRKGRSINWNVRSRAKTGEKNIRWKGDDACYGVKHRWVRKMKNAKKCEFCGNAGRLQMACKDHSYRRNLDDWIALCPSCHLKFDHDNNGREWKARSGGTKNCRMCNKEIYVKTCLLKTKMYCSEKCRLEARKISFNKTI